MKEEAGEKGKKHAGRHIRWVHDQAPPSFGKEKGEKHNCHEGYDLKEGRAGKSRLHWREKCRKENASSGHHGGKNRKNPQDEVPGLHKKA